MPVNLEKSSMNEELPAAFSQAGRPLKNSMPACVDPDSASARALTARHRAAVERPGSIGRLVGPAYPLRPLGAPPGVRIAPRSPRTRPHQRQAPGFLLLRGGVASVLSTAADYRSIRTSCTLCSDSPKET